MSEQRVISAQPREIIGRANRKLAATGQIPAVLYGAGHESTPIAVDRHTFEQFLIHNPGAALVSVEVEGSKKPVNAVIKEVQRSAVKGTILHVDFLAVRMDKAIGSVVPVHYVNDPQGVREGGVLTIDRHEVNIEAKPGDIPDSLEADVSALLIGDSLKISDLTPPSGVTLTDDPDSVICSVTMPTKIEEVVEEVEELEEGVEVAVEGEAPAEPEVIGEESSEEE